MKLLDQMRDFATTAHALGQYDVEQIVTGWVDFLEKSNAMITVEHPSPLGIPNYALYDGRVWYVRRASSPGMIYLEALCGCAHANVPLAKCTHVYLTPLADPEEYDDEV